MQTCAQWLRSNCRVDLTMDDEELERAGDPPDPSAYQAMKEVRRLVIHHSATETGSARVFRALHRAVNGWVDIGYHFVIGNGTLSADGQVETGRPEWAVGAHARENNDDSLGICLVGDMNMHPPTGAQLGSLAGVLKDLMRKYGLDSGQLLLHGQLPQCRTECPGRYITPELVTDLLEGP